MNSKFFLSFTTLALVALSNAQYFEYANSFSFSSITTVAGNPIVVGKNASGTFYCSGTNMASLVQMTVGNHTSSYPGNSYISHDGTKINIGMDTTNFGDGTTHSEMAQYNITTATLTPFGALNYYASSGTIKTGSSGWGISGDGDTIVGQAYKGISTTVFTFNFVAPCVGSSSGATSLIPAQATNNSRVQCANYDGSVIGGYINSSGTGTTWTKVGGVWQPGVTVTAGYPTPASAVVTLGGPTAMSYNGRLMAGNGLTANGNRPYLYDLTLDAASYIPLLDEGATHNYRGTATGLSTYGDVMTGYWVDLLDATNVAKNIAFVWTPTMGHIKLNALLDTNYPGSRASFDLVNNLPTNLTRAFSMSPDGEWVLGGFALPGTGSATKSYLAHLGTALRGNGSLLEFIGDQSAETLTFTLKDSTNATVDTWTGKLDSRGHFCWLSKVDLGSADFHLFVKGSHWLAKSILVNASTKNSLNFSLINGDVHDDNVIDLTDYTELVVAFDALLVDPNNGNAPSANWQASADLNGDGAVDLTDYIIVATNFNMVGDN